MSGEITTKRIMLWFGAAVLVAVIAIAVFAAADKGGANTETPVFADIGNLGWKRGSAEAQTVLVEFSDFECPACAYYYPLVERLLSEYGDKILYVYRHFPLQQHRQAEPASWASEAAGNQGKFWEMYNMIFENQTVWAGKSDADDIFRGYAETLGLDMEQYDEDISSKSVKDKVRKDYSDGIGFGVNSTPTFFLNGKKISNPAGYEALKAAIDNELQSEQI